MPISRLFRRLSAASRRKKFDLLRRLLGDAPRPRILDLGGEMDSLVPLLQVLPPGAEVVALNRLAGHLRQVRAQLPAVACVLGDARQLPFPDQSFDLICCNAVIEHLGTFAAQQAMAREIQRVGRAWFVTTPNRWFPFEFHSRLPFVSWLPMPLLHRAARLWSYDHANRRYGRGHDQSDLQLLSARRLRQLFPTSRIVRNRITLWPETLVAVGRGAPD